MTQSALCTARDIHKGLLSAKAIVCERMASTPPSVRRYMHYQQLLADYDMRISQSTAQITVLEEDLQKIVIAETEANKEKLTAATTITEPEEEIDISITESVYSAVLNSTD